MQDAEDARWARAVAIARSCASLGYDLDSNRKQQLQEQHEQEMKEQQQQQQQLQQQQQEELQEQHLREMKEFQQQQLQQQQQEEQQQEVEEEQEEEEESAEDEEEQLQKEEDEDDDGWLGFGSASTSTLSSRLAAASVKSRSRSEDENDEVILAVPRPRSQQPAKLLILADMNGTLLLRTKKKVKMMRRAPDLFHNGLHYYLRQHALDLVQTLLAPQPYFGDRIQITFAFYTSMQEQSARPAVDLLSKGFRPEIYARPFNKPDPTAPQAYDTMRNLDLLWATPGRVAHGFDASNTLVIDDSARKMRERPHNVCVVPEFDETTANLHDAALEGLKGYLLMLSRALVAQSDVRTFVAANPFSPSSSDS